MFTTGMVPAMGVALGTVEEVALTIMVTVFLVLPLYAVRIHFPIVLPVSFSFLLLSFFT